MSLELPAFTYHPDPRATGSVVVSDAECDACGSSRGVVYEGPMYGRDHGWPSLCPWCIADGSAAERFGLEFSDLYDRPPDVADAVVEAIRRRTPGYVSWQGGGWCFHCGDGCEFLGDVGGKELARFGEGARTAAIATIRTGMWPNVPDDLEALVDRLPRAADLAIYLFRCLHCAEFQVRWDMS